jgi:hypothetical protein
LKLRGDIRDIEQDIPKLAQVISRGVDLPSEDSIMDHPKKYLREMQEKYDALKELYDKMERYIGINKMRYDESIEEGNKPTKEEFDKEVERLTAKGMDPNVAFATAIMRTAKKYPNAVKESVNERTGDLTMEQGNENDLLVIGLEGYDDTVALAKEDVEILIRELPKYLDRLPSKEEFRGQESRIKESYDESDVKDMEDDLKGMKSKYKELKDKERKWQQGSQKSDFNTPKWREECDKARKEIEDWEKEIAKAKKTPKNESVNEVGQSDEDFTGKLYDIVQNGETEDGEKMFSISRPVYSFWNGFANAVLDAGYDKPLVWMILGSRMIRHYLDSIEHLEQDKGYKVGQDFIKKNKEAVDTMIKEEGPEA